jgi:hypothetical protein
VLLGLKAVVKVVNVFMGLKNAVRLVSV